jgi:hypothetical protein
MIRLISGSGAAVAFGIGTLAITSAACAASTLNAPDRSGVQSAPTTAIGGVWEGHYTCGQGLTGLDLRISGPGPGGALRVRLSFYPLPSNPRVPVGIAIYHGTYDSASRIELRPSHWVRHPPGYHLVDFSGRISGDRFNGTVSPDCTTFSTRKPKGHPAPADVVGTWKGSYLGCAQGPAGLRLVVKRRSGSRLKATFNFFALPSNPAVRAGSYAMTGFYFPGGIALAGTRWIHRPSGYRIVNLVGKSPRSGARQFSGAVARCSTFSLTRS